MERCCNSRHPQKKMFKADVEQLFDALHDAGAFTKYHTHGITAEQKKNIHGYSPKKGKSTIDEWSTKLQKLQTQYDKDHPTAPINLTAASTHTARDLKCSLAVYSRRRFVRRRSGRRCSAQTSCPLAHARAIRTSHFFFGRDCRASHGKSHALLASI